MILAGKSRKKITEEEFPRSFLGSKVGEKRERGTRAARRICLFAKAYCVFVCYKGVPVCEGVLHSTQNKKNLATSAGRE